MIVAEQLTKYYGDKLAVSGIDLKIEQGEIVGFLGLNGAGKTTVLRMLAGDLLPSSGRILVEGMDLAERPRELGRWVGFLPEVPPIYPSMTVEEYLYHLARLRGLSRTSARASLQAAMAKTGLVDVAGMPTGELSHGYRKRLGIAQAIVHAPKLVILDEPTSGLDPVQVVEMRKLIKVLAQDRTVLLSSHHLSEVRETCTRLVLLLSGKIAAQGTETELAKDIQGTCTIEVTVAKAKDGEKAGDVLQELESVQDVTIKTVSEGMAEITLTASEDIRPEVARTLVEGGFDLLRMVRVGDDLEKVFLQVAGEMHEEVHGNA